MIDYTWNKLTLLEGVTVYGPNPAEVPRTGTISFNIDGFDHGLAAAALNDYYNIQLLNGCFCAHPYVRELLKRELWEIDLDPDDTNIETLIERKRGMVRASFGLYTTIDDLKKLILAVNDLINRREEILGLYEPVGKNGYRHKYFVPSAEDIFNPEVLLAQSI